MKLTIVLALVVSLSSCAFSAVKRPDLANTKSPLVSSYNLSTSEATNNASNTLTIMGYTPIKDSDGEYSYKLSPHANTSKLRLWHLEWYCRYWNSRLTI